MRGVGNALAEKLQRLGVTQVQDLLFVLPSRYEDRTRIWPIGELTPGIRAAVEGEIQLTEVTYRKRRQMLCRISDGSGFLTLRFFYFSASQQNGLTRGLRIRCFGEIRRGPFGLEIVHPEYRRVREDDAKAPAEETLTKSLFGHDCFLKQPLVFSQLPDKPDNDRNVGLSRFSDLKAHFTVA